MCDDAAKRGTTALSQTYRFYGEHECPQFKCAAKSVTKSKAVLLGDYVTRLFNDLGDQAARDKNDFFLAHVHAGSFSGGYQHHERLFDRNSSNSFCFA